MRVIPWEIVKVITKGMNTKLLQVRPQEKVILLEKLWVYCKVITSLTWLKTAKQNCTYSIINVTIYNQYIKC